MPCPRCGCRLVTPSRLGHGRLVCCDCGRPMESHLNHRKPLSGWRPKGIAALMLVLGLAVMGLLALRDGLTREGEGLLDPAMEPIDKAKEE